MKPKAVIEVETSIQLQELLDAGTSLAGARLQGLDLRPFEERLLHRHDLQGLIVLGGRLSSEVEQHLRAGGAVIFPADPRSPVRPFRGTLYTAAELYDGIRQNGYDTTLDARAYAWLEDVTVNRDAYITMLRAIHDDAMSDALDSLLADRRAVGVMGGHALTRGTHEFAQAAHLGHALAEQGYVVLTGGGPGAMEAANLGAWADNTTELTRALDTVAQVPSFSHGVERWVLAGLDATAHGTATPDAGAPDASALADEQTRSVGIPTWHFGHEPPNVFAQQIAKYFSNAVREDELLRRSRSGLVVLPGAAGTVQEIFQMATRLYYEAEGPLTPLILVGSIYWREQLPVWSLLTSLGHDRAMGDLLHLVDEHDEAVEILTSYRC